MEADRGKHDGQTATELHSSLDRLDQLWDVGVARIESRIGVNNANDWPRQGIVTITGSLDKCLSKEQRKVRITV